MLKFSSTRIALFCLSMRSLIALTVGNPAQPQIIDQGFWIPQDALVGVKVGYEGDRVQNRKMRANGGAHGRIDAMTLSFDQGVVILNYMDRLELYGSVGSMHGEVSHRPHLDRKCR